MIVLLFCWIIVVVMLNRRCNVEILIVLVLLSWSFVLPTHIADSHFADCFALLCLALPCLVSVFPLHITTSVCPFSVGVPVCLLCCMLCLCSPIASFTRASPPVWSGKEKVRWNSGTDGGIATVLYGRPRNLGHRDKGIKLVGKRVGKGALE